jgi:hypothetical protein
MESTASNWFGNIKKKMNSLYNTAKGTPVETTPILPSIRGGSKKKRSRKQKKSRKLKGTRKVRFSKKHKVYTIRRYKK